MKQDEKGKEWRKKNNKKQKKKQTNKQEDMSLVIDTAHRHERLKIIWVLL